MKGSRGLRACVQEIVCLKPNITPVKVHSVIVSAPPGVRGGEKRGWENLRRGCCGFVGGGGELWWVWKVWR